MATSDVKPKSISRAKKWSEEIENLYRFQQAGYRDEIEYKQVKQVAMVNLLLFIISADKLLCFDKHFAFDKHSQMVKYF
jgi:hypothetical protein